MSELNLDQDQAIEEAKTYGMKIRYGDAQHLLIDLDDDDAVYDFPKQLEFLNSLIGAEEVERYESKSGGTHIIVKLERKLPITQLLLLECVLGSDLKRALYGLARYWNNPKRDSRMLFRPKAKAKPKPKQQAVDERRAFSTPDPFLLDDDVSF